MQRNWSQQENETTIKSPDVFGSKLSMYNKELSYHLKSQTFSTILIPA